MRVYRRVLHGISKDAVGAISARGLAVACTFIMTALVSRRLTADETGVFFVMMSISVAGATVGRWGTDTYVLKAIASGALGVSGYRYIVRLCISRALLLALVTPAVAVLLVDDVFWGHQDLVFLCLATAIAVFGSALSVFFGAALRGNYQVAMGIMVETGLVPLVTIAILVAVPGSLNAAAALGAFGLASLVAAALGALYARLTLAVPRRAGIEVADRAAEKSRISMMATAFLFYLLTWAPVMTLGYLGMSREAAFFSIAARIANFINIVPVLQNSYIAPQIARANARGNAGQVSSIASSAARRALVVAVPAATFLFLSPWVVTTVFGAQYAPAVSPMRILVVGAALVIAMGPVNPVMLTCGREGIATTLNTVLLIVTVAGILVTARQFGATGVAVISAGAVVAYAVTAMAILIRGDHVRTAAWMRT